MKPLMTRRMSKVWRPWLAGWLGMVVIAVLNGTIRALVTQPLLGEEIARRVATAVLLALLTAYAWVLHRRYPIPTRLTAWTVGLSWVAMTLAFEFGFGRFVEGLSWSTMLADYDISNGRIWILVPIWTCVLPAVVRRLQAPTALYHDERRRTAGSLAG